MYINRTPAVVLGLWLLCSTASAAWHEPSSPLRRAIHIDVDENRITGDELAMAIVLLNGSHNAAEVSFRLTTAAGKPLASKVIANRGGDQIELVFNPQKGTRDYFIYFGGEASAPNSGELNRAGLLVELKALFGESGNSAPEMRMAYERQRETLGNRLILQPFLGANPISPGRPSISRVSGKLFAPITGNYVFAVAADDRAALFIDSKPVVLARYRAADARFQEQITLQRGHHDFELIHADSGDDYMFTVAWKRPDMQSFETIGREFFGTLLQCRSGALEQRDKPLTADMQSAYLGESYFGGNYAHRYRLQAASALRAGDRLQASWDFGDGQTAVGQEVEHVFLAEAVHPIRITTRVGDNSDTQQFMFKPQRDSARLEYVSPDELFLQARLVAGYDLQKLDPKSLALAIVMQLRAGRPDDALRAAEQLVQHRSQPSVALATTAIKELHDDLLSKRQGAKMSAILAHAPADGDLQPFAAVMRANLLMYEAGNFSAALDTIAPLANRDDAARRTYGQALLLAGRAEEARKTLASLRADAVPQKNAALAGALARTTEFYILQKDAAGGEQAWEKWMATLPGEFLEGNAALMRVRLIEIRGEADVAAKVAEAYANANPQSAYAPQLLHRASALLAAKAPAKSATLRALLKQRYPEDPLSQK